MSVHHDKHDKQHSTTSTTSEHKQHKHHKQQQALDSLYAIGNVLTIKITMPQTDWDAVRTEQPAGGVCNFEWTGGSRYTWRKATSVEISGTSFPAQTMFTEVGVKKKSFCGSINSDKPCLHIDFGKFSKANVPLIEALIGSRYLTLNNTIQDRSYIRQPLGYKLLAMAGLPNSRCNFARVFVNGTLIGQGVGGVNSPGIFVNAEPVMPRYIERNFNGNMNGNLYELEHGDDLVSARLPFMEPESLSKFNNKADLQFADDHIAANGLVGANQMLDLDQFIKIYAMEFFLKHWDGYANNTNNTYIYNDVNAVAAPGVNNVKFKMIPWGIDQIFQPNRHFKMANRGLIANLVRNDAARLAQLIDQIRTYRETVFSRETQQTLLKPMIDQMEALLVGFGVPNAVSQIATVRQQLRLAESAGYLCAGLPGTSAVYILKDDTSECLHASNAEGIPAATPNPCASRLSIAPFQTIMIIRIYGASTILEPESRLPVRLTAAFSTPATRSQRARGTNISTPVRQTTSTMPKNSRLFPLIHRTSLPLVAISSLPASGRICAQLMALTPRQNRAGQGSIRTWIPMGPTFTSIDQ